MGRLSDDVDSGVRDYFRDLKSGLHWNVDAHYMLSESLGIGINYNAFQSTAKSASITRTFPDGTMEQGVRTEQYIGFIGLSLLTRFVTKNERNAWALSLAVGNHGYRDEQQAGERITEITGNAFGYISNIGYDFGVTENLFINLSTSLTLGYLNDIEVREGDMVSTLSIKEETGEREYLGRINFSVGIRLLL